jgi:two-component system, LytTR family, sensor kinase
MASFSTSSRLYGALGLCAATWAGVQTYIIHSLGFIWFIAFTDASVSLILLSAACWLINNNLRYYQPGRGSYVNIIFWNASLAVVCAIGCRWTLPLITTGAAYLNFLVQSVIIRGCIFFLAIGWVATVSILFYSQIDQRENERRKAEAEKLARDAELYNLRQQLQPHFLFNSLNSINALIGFKPDEARRMIHQLSDFLRGTLKKDDQQQVPLTDELQHLNLYLDIEKVRFGHRLQTEISCDEQSKSAVLPSMLLQPLVENAIKFGLYDTTEDVVVSIRAEMEGSYLILMVQNPFDPQTSRPKKGTGFGLRGVQRRLYLLFARNDLMETHANDNIFTTIIKVPQLSI